MGVPSCEAMVTVGRVAIVAEVVSLNLIECAVGFASFFRLCGRKESALAVRA